MKKYMAILALMIVCQTGYAQKNVDQLFKEFAKVENTETVKIGKFLMSFAGLFTDTMGVDEIEVYSFNNDSEDLRDRLTKAMRTLKDAKFETMVTSNEGNSRVKVLVRIEKDMIRELVVMSTGDDNALVRIKGKIKPSDIEQVVDKHGKGDC